MKVVDRIYQLRREFIIIGLTGRTGSGCSTVANILSQTNFNILKSLHQEWNPKVIDNDARKNRIIYNYIKNDWTPFRIIKASDVIFLYVLSEGYETFYQSFGKAENDKAEDNKAVDDKTEAQKLIDTEQFKDLFNSLSETAKECNETLEKHDYSKENIKKIKILLEKSIPEFRDKLEELLRGTTKEILTSELQKWGNNIRLYDSIKKQDSYCETSPSCLARKINQIIEVYWEEDKCFNKSVDDKKKRHPTLIVIDALRNPYEVLYFRERYAAFYLMSVNTTEKIRYDALFKKNYKLEEIKNLDIEEAGKKDFSDSFQKIDIDKCIELSDIHLTHDDTPADKNRDLVNQIFTYLSLIKHPGLVSPSPIERLMQIAYTAKLNSGCLSRQVGAAVTDEYFSLKSVGWNTTAEGQTPCALRCLDDLHVQEDENAYSNHERNDEDFRKAVNTLYNKYDKTKLNGLPLVYCFKDIYTSINQKQKGNQVHTRSLHAEENAFLQLAKYGSMGIKGGKLFTTASPCELCAKKAYQLGIKEIYYIDSYPGISQKHILESGENQPKMILFKGAIGRAYINLYNPLLPQKDEIEMLSGIKVKEELCKLDSEAINKEKTVQQ